MLSNGNADDPWEPNGEDSLRLPLFGEQTVENAETTRQNNEDALRHHLDLLGWKAQDDPELAEILIPFLYHMEEIKLSWVAESFYLSLRETREFARSRLFMEFQCLHCWVALEPKDQRHHFLLKRSLDAFCRGKVTDPPHELLCAVCLQQKTQIDEEQRQAQRLHHEAQLAASRNVPYENRRKSVYWQRLKRIVLARAGYRCQLCGRSDVSLDVHHNTYCNYGQEELEDLIALCRSCHERYHVPLELPDAS